MRPNLLRGGMASDATQRTIQMIAQKHRVSPAFIDSQMKKGVKVEMEHTVYPDVAAYIAADHLVEIPDYYDRLEEMEAMYFNRHPNMGGYGTLGAGTYDFDQEAEGILFEPATLLAFLDASDYPIESNKMGIDVGDRDILPLLINDAGHPIPLGAKQAGKGTFITNSATGNILAMSLKKEVPQTYTRRDPNVTASTPGGIYQYYITKKFASGDANPGSAFLWLPPTQVEKEIGLGVKETVTYRPVFAKYFMLPKQMNWADDVKEKAVNADTKQSAPVPPKPSSLRAGQTPQQKQRAIALPKIYILQGRPVRYGEWVEGLQTFIDVSTVPGQKGKPLEIQYGPDDYILDQETWSLMAHPSGAFYRANKATESLEKVYVLPGEIDYPGILTTAIKWTLGGLAVYGFVKLFTKQKRWF